MKMSTVFRRLDRLYSDPRRWISGSYSDHRGPRKLQCFCLAGGINKITGNDLSQNASQTPEGRALFDAIKELHPRTKKDHVEAWNDAPRRKIGEIRRVVKRALRNAERAEAA